MKLTRSTPRRHKKTVLVDVPCPLSMSASKSAGYPATVSIGFGHDADGASYDLDMTPGEAELLADRLLHRVRTAREMDAAPVP